MRWLRQANAGPAAARNAGFRAAEGTLVFFVDDDILVPPDLVRAHAAAHRAHPLSVIFGLCPFVPEPRPTPFRRFVDEREGAPVPTGAVTAMPTVASGQISVEREQFAADAGVYSSDLVTPAAEEYELAHRLRRRGTPILLVPAMRALHDQAVEIASYCRQQYKHGLGCGEAAAKQPDLLGLPELARVIEANRAGDSPRRVRSGVKSVAARPAVRAALLALARAQEPSCSRPLRDAAYRAAIRRTSWPACATACAFEPGPMTRASLTLEATRRASPSVVGAPWRAMPSETPRQARAISIGSAGKR